MSNLAWKKETDKVKELMLKGGEGLKVGAVNGPESIPGVNFSDHRNFWTYGYPGDHDHGHCLPPESSLPSDEKVIQALYYRAINF